MAVAFLIDVKGLDVMPWLDLARQSRTKKWWIKVLSSQAGSPYAQRRWWVTHDAISTDRFAGAWERPEAEGDGVELP